MRQFGSRTGHLVRLIGILAVGFGLAGRPAYANHLHYSSQFQGVKANVGSVAHASENGVQTLTLSEDFKIPDAPAPHWQVVDSKGNVYLLQRLEIKGGKFNRQITLPPYIKDVAKVQIWCAWAETLLGEATFPHPVK
jgi:hypothetical protein